VTRIQTARGRIPLWLMCVTTKKVVYPATNEVDWLTSYRLFGVFVLRQDHRKAGAMVTTTLGPLPAKDLELTLRHREMPCGTSIVTEHLYQGEVVKRDVRQEIYTVESTKGVSAWRKHR
jgi:hypothetical protein